MIYNGTLTSQFSLSTYVQSHGEDGLVVDYFSFSSSIADHLKSASLVISHAGKTSEVASFILCCLYI